MVDNLLKRLLAVVLQIDKAQDHVQHAKAMLAKNSCAELQEQLRLARHHRNEEQKKIESLLVARELIIHSLPQVQYIVQRIEYS